MTRTSYLGRAALETLVYQQLRALNDYHRLGYQIFYWRTRDQREVDFVLYGDRGIRAFDIKRAATLRPADVAGLRSFLRDYGDAADDVYLLYGGNRELRDDNIRMLPLETWLPRLGELIG